MDKSHAMISSTIREELGQPRRILEEKSTRCGEAKKVDRVADHLDLQPQLQTLSSLPDLIASHQRIIRSLPHSARRFLSLSALF